MWNALKKKVMWKVIESHVERPGKESHFMFDIIDISVSSVYVCEEPGKNMKDECVMCVWVCCVYRL